MPRRVERFRATPVPRGSLGLVLGFTLLTLPAASATGLGSPDCAYQVRLFEMPTGGPVPLLVNFSASVSSGSPTFFNWSFGDGGSWNDTSGASSSPLHRYSTVGIFVATVTVGEAGCDATASVRVSVMSGPLAVRISASPAGGAAPLTVVFNASVSGGSGTYASATWTFGDGGVGSGLNLAYTYARSGTYLALLNVTDSGGLSGVAQTMITVTATPGRSSGVAPVPLWGYPIVGAAVGAVVFAAYWRARPVRASRSPEAAVGERPGIPVAPRSEEEPPATVPGAPSGPAAGSSAAPAPVLPELPLLAPAQAAHPAPEGPPPSTAARADQLRLSERVVLHIGRQGTLSSYDVAPVALTQAGMGESLAASQNSLTNVLRRLTAAGALAQELRHVRGRSRRLRVYSLTPRGERLYLELRSRAGPPAPSAEPGKSREPGDPP